MATPRTPRPSRGYVYPPSFYQEPVKAGDGTVDQEATMAAAGESAVAGATTEAPPEQKDATETKVAANKARTPASSTKKTARKRGKNK